MQNISAFKGQRPIQVTIFLGSQMKTIKFGSYDQLEEHHVAGIALLVVTGPV